MPKLYKDKNGMWGKKQTDDAKSAIANYRRNTKWMFDPLTQTQKAVDKNEVDRYLVMGWKLGRFKYRKEPDFLLSF